LRMMLSSPFTLPLSSFSFNNTAPPELYTLSLHDALPILPDHSSTVTVSPADSVRRWMMADRRARTCPSMIPSASTRYVRGDHRRSEEHTSELQSRSDLVCRLLLEKKKNTTTILIRASSSN